MRERRAVVVWLQGVSLVWMLVECGVAGYAAASAHSPAMLAFGADSLVELFSAVVVLLQFAPAMALSERRAGKIAGWLLFALAAVVAVIALAAIGFGVRPAESRAAISISCAALVVMPVLAWLKRREGRRAGNAALIADAVQSATCAYIALLSLAGTAANALLHLPWLDVVAALAIVPFLIKEGRAALRGESCGCC